MITADQMTNTEYHLKKEYISSSDVKMVHGKSLAHWKSKIYKSSTAFDIGTCVHSMVLEDGEGMIRGPENRRGKAWTDLYDEAQANGDTLLTTCDYDLARNIADSVLFHPAGQRMAGGTTINESSFFATDPVTQLKIKCRPDSYWDAKGVIYDLKTCQDSSPRAVGADILKYGYALQQAFYMHTLTCAGYDATQFVFVNVEKSAPFSVSTNTISPEYLAWGKQQMHITLEKIARANEAQKWDTGWSDTTNVVVMPRWLQQDASQF